MRKHRVRLQFLFFVLCVMTALCGCTRGELFSSRGRSIEVRVASSLATRTVQDVPARRHVATITLSEEPADPLYLHVYEEDMNEARECASAQTKGAEVTSDNISEFFIDAYAEEDWTDADGNEQPAGEYFWALAMKDNGTWTLDDNYIWPEDVPLTFWSYNGSTAPSFSATGGYDKFTFSHNMLNNSRLSATGQEDLVFAYNHERRNFGERGQDGKLDIHFYHALSAIRFDISGVSGHSVDKIILGNISAYGNCAVNTDAGYPEFVWTLSSSGLRDFSQEFTSSDFKSDGKMVDGSEKEFMIIPQTLRDDAFLRVIFDGDQTLTKNISGTTMLPGKYYTYKITRNEDIDHIFTFTVNGDISSEYTVDGNRSVSSTSELPVVSLMTRTDMSNPVQLGWKILSYQIDGQDPVTVDGGSFDSNPCWFGSSGGNSEEILIKALACESVNKGKHVYWMGEGREGDEGWSPESWEGQGTIDLSRMDPGSDVPGNSIEAHGMTTSNCYIVRHAGSYKLPLVYGNAVKGGSPNVFAYAPGLSAQYCLGTFLNHLDQEITSPFIENNAGCAVYGNPEILWQSDGPVVTNVRITPSSLSGGDIDVTNVRYLEFDVPQETVEQSNALIAVKDAEGRIIWSWHIWVTNNPEVVAPPIEVTNFNGRKYHFLGVDNIGSISTDSYVPRPDVTLTLQQDVSGNIATLKVLQKKFETDRTFMFYEWGRKDPFIVSGKDYAGNDAVDYIFPTAMENPSPITLGYAIQHPDMYYGFYYIRNEQEVSSTSVDWLDPMPRNLWTGRISGNKLQDNIPGQTIKTIYDPSPVGYMVPSVGAYTGFCDLFMKHFYTNDQAESFLHMNSPEKKYADGYYFYTSLGEGNVVNDSGPVIWFGANGMIPGGVSAYKLNRNIGWFYTSSLNSEQSYMFAFEQSLFGNISMASPSNAHCIRPVLETDPQ